MLTLRKLKEKRRYGLTGDAHEEQHLAFDAFVKSMFQQADDFLRGMRRGKGLVGMIQIDTAASILFSYGPEYNRKVFAKVAHTIEEVMGGRVFIARFGIERFMFCYDDSDYSFQDRMEQVMEKLRCFADPRPESPVYISLFCGVTNYERKKDFALCATEAFTALFQSRKLSISGNVVHFSDVGPSMRSYHNKLRLASYFQKAIATQSLRLAFQPIVSTVSGDVQYYESLLRVVTDDGNIISAGPFIPVAEEMGYIEQVDLIVLEMVVAELKRAPEITLSLNISNISVDSPTWYRHAVRLLQDPMVASRLIVEITETGAYQDLRKVAIFVDKMQSLGCQVAIDDFGAGYTSFSQLQAVNADIIKIDGAFVRDIVDNQSNQLFVKTLLEFARGFNLKTVAEFVETGDIAKVLIDLKVDYLQGNYFAPALNYRSWNQDDCYRKVK